MVVCSSEARPVFLSPVGKDSQVMEGSCGNGMCSTSPVSIRTQNKVIITPSGLLVDNLECVCQVITLSSCQIFIIEFKEFLFFLKNHSYNARSSNI